MVCILIFCCLKVSYVDAFVISPHEISTDTTWNKAEGPYLIPWPLTIHVGSTLVIEPGTVIALQGSPIIIEGTLRIGSSSSESVVFESVLESRITSPEVDPPSDTARLLLDVRAGSLDISNIEIRGHLSLQAEGGLLTIDGLTAQTGDIRFDHSTHATGTAMSIQQSDFIVLLDHSSLALQATTINGGYINIDTQSSLSFQYSKLFDVEKIRVLNQSLCTFEYVHVSGGGGFLIKNKSAVASNDSVIENILTDTAFSVSTQSKTFFQNSVVSPLLSNFTLLVDGSELHATSTQVVHILQRGIQAVRNATIKLYDVQLSDTLTTTPVDTFLVSLVGSTLTASQSSFLSTTGNAIELYNSSAKPYSTITIKDSIIKDYGGSGIYAVQATGTIERTRISDGRKGIESIFSHLSITESNISHNTEYGAIAYAPAYTLTAQNNFWGDTSGPHHDVLMPLGIGDVVSDNVLFEPWLSKDPLNPCCSSVMFLPGLMASRLYVLDADRVEKKLWEPTTVGGGHISDLFLDDTGTSLRDEIYTRDVIDETPVLLVGLNVYKSFMKDMDDIQSTGYIQDWETIPYDWRLSLYDVLERGQKVGRNISYAYATTLPYLITEFRRLARESKTGRVTLVAHSNGGLVAKALAIQLKNLGVDTLIDKVVLVAVPQVGTPQAVGALLHGFGQGIPKDSFSFLASPKLMQTFGFNMPGAYGLLPSRAYFTSGADPLITFATSSITTFPDFLYFLRQLNPLLLSYGQNIHKEIDEWIPPAHIKVVQIGGWGRDTVKGIRYYQGVKNKKPFTQYDPLFTENGDQTVVIPSALFLPSTTSNVSRFWINLKQANKGSFIKRSHADILELSEIRNLVKESILSEPITHVRTIATSSPVELPNKKIQILLHSETAELDMYDGVGNHTGVSTTTGLVEENIPDSSYGRLGSVIYIRIPEENSATTNDKRIYVQTFAPASVEDMYTIDVARMVDESAATTTSFVDVSVSGTTTAFLSIPESLDEIPVLEIDANNDGVVDYRVKPGAEYIPVTSQHQTSGQSGSRHKNIFTISTSSVPDVTQAAVKNAYTGLYIHAATSTGQKNSGVVSYNQTASVFNALSRGKIFSVGFLSFNLKHMKKVIGIILAVGILGGIVFMYMTRPASAPTQDINTVVSAKLPAGSAASSVYRISQEKSLVKFTMNEMLNGSPFLVVGTTTQIAGDIVIKDGKLGVGELAINAKTLVTDSSKRNGAIVRLILKSEAPGNEFITFKPTSNILTGTIETGKALNFTISGDLTISGVTKPVTFTTSATVTDSQINGTASVTIKRSDFNIKIPNLSFIANVDDAFPVTISIVADRIMQ